MARIIRICSGFFAICNENLYLHSVNNGVAEWTYDYVHACVFRSFQSAEQYCDDNNISVDFDGK